MNAETIRWERPQLDTRIRKYITELDGKRILRNIYRSVINNNKAIAEQTTDIDSLNISRKVQKCMKFLDDKTISFNDKIAIHIFLCDLLYDIYYFNKEKKDIISTNICNTIMENDNIIDRVKICFLDFTPLDI